jgi:transcriptional regulator of acetoin/glycerol metabolism
MSNLAIYIAACKRKEKVVDIIGTYSCHLTLAQLLNSINVELDNVESKMVEVNQPSSVTGMTQREIDVLRINEAMKECNGNIAKVATKIGLSRATVYRRLQEEKLLKGKK